MMAFTSKGFLLVASLIIVFVETVSSSSSSVHNVGYSISSSSSSSSLVVNKNQMSASASAAFVSYKRNQLSTSFFGCCDGSSRVLPVLQPKPAAAISSSTTALSHTDNNDDDNDPNDESNHNNLDKRRRSFLAFTLAAGIATPATIVNAASLPFFSKTTSGSTGGGGSSFFLLNSKNSTAATPVTVREPIDIQYSSLASESCLLSLLPVRNKAFRYLEKELQSISRVRGSALDPDLWKDVFQTSEGILLYLDSQRSQLEPVFNQEDSTMQSINKAERGERLVEELRTQVIQLCNATSVANATKTYRVQKEALYTLSQIGELLVPKYPYDVPTQGKYSFLPRLYGRTRVTFTIKRRDKFLGNVTVVADGYAAPITAGNFVDLCLRGFYTGLPVKYFKKRLSVAPEESEGAAGAGAAGGLGKDGVLDTEGGGGSGEAGGMFASTLGKIKKGVKRTLEDIEADIEEDTVTEGEDDTTILKSIPILGSFGEGFYDPLTAKPRRMPLEIVRIDRLTGTLKLSYSGTFSANDLASSTENSDKSAKLVKVDNFYNYEPLSNNRPVLSFSIPGLVAWNHPDRQLNGGTSEFFSLPLKDIGKETTRLMNRQYAPFGYIIEGLDLMQNIKSGDVIAATDVDQWGALSLVKIRGTSFADVMQSGGDDESGGGDNNDGGGDDDFGKEKGGTVEGGKDRETKK
uniref:peptidylprolyl isomerase n=1 Tax=Helicotheca tamesis TaxID=374047 RepID=A0A7S2MR43_9STRA|mmetsp:Transcript_20197/g.27688  ORF Transcript_20197/g.27688 Transcript_20197/m.27688 type:complete len:690 (+) Transcript_20197:111-2180(+)